MVFIDRVDAPPAGTRARDVAEVLRTLDLPFSRLRESELAEVVMAVSRRLDLWQDLVEVSPVGRWWMPLHAADNFEVMLQTWNGEHATDWHDHGGSSGAFAVTSGALFERYRATDGATVMERRITLGKVAAFGPGHVHDVGHVAGPPALSIHAYSPALTRLTYYERTSLGFVSTGIGPDVHRLGGAAAQG